MPLEASFFHGEELGGCTVELEEDLVDVLRGLEIEGALSGDPAVETIVMGDDCVSGGQGLDERRIGSTNAMTVEISASVEPQSAHDVSFEHGAEKNDLWTGGRKHGLLVARTVRSILPQDD